MHWYGCSVCYNFTWMQNYNKLDIIISFDTMRSVKPDLMFDKKNASKSLNELVCQILIQMKIMLHFYRCENGSVYS